MDTINDATPFSGKELKREDLMQYSNLFASEYNKSGIHDRVLIFQVMEQEDLNLIGNYKEDVTDDSFEEATCPIKQVNDSENNAGAGGSNDDCAGDVMSLSQTCSKLNTEDFGEVEIASERVQLESKSSLTHDYDIENGSTEIDGNAKNEKEKEIEERREQLDENDDDSESYDASSADFIVKEHKIFVHSSWLAVQSPYFRALFYSGMKETYSKDVFMRITEKETIPHLTLIEAMYKPDVLDNKECDLVLNVLSLANKYDVALVFKKCKYVLLCMPLSLQVCESILATVNEMLNTDDLLSILETFLLNEFNPLDQTWQMDKFSTLTEAAIRLLLTSNNLTVLSENTVFVALMRWNYSNFLPTSSSLLSLVRFELMTADFIYDVVQHHYLAMKMNDFHQLLLNGFSYHSLSAERKNLLEIKPIKRAEYNNKEQPTFTWVIDSGTRKQAAASTTLSKRFWWCGYEMALSLLFESNTCSIFLYIHRVPRTAYLYILCKIKSSLFLKSLQLFEGPIVGGKRLGRTNITCKCIGNIPEHENDTIDLYVNLKN